MAAASAASGDSPPATSSKVIENTRAAASAASGNPPQTSSPAESVGAAQINFSFASPVAEDRTHNAMEGISDPQLSPEDLQQQLEDPPSLTLPHKGESVRENTTEPASEDITITEEKTEKQLPRRLQVSWAGLWA